MEISLSTLSQQLRLSEDLLNDALEALSAGRLSRALLMDMLARRCVQRNVALDHLINFEIEALAETPELRALQHALEHHEHAD